MISMASQIPSLTIVYSAVYSDADQRKHQSFVSLAFVREIHRWPVNSSLAQMTSNAENISIWRYHHANWMEKFRGTPRVVEDKNTMLHSGGYHNRFVSQPVF